MSTFPSITNASGVWTLRDQHVYAQGINWPGYRFTIEVLLVGAGGGGGGADGDSTAGAGASGALVYGIYQIDYIVSYTVSVGGGGGAGGGAVTGSGAGTAGASTFGAGGAGGRSGASGTSGGGGGGGGASAIALLGVPLVVAPGGGGGGGANEGVQNEQLSLGGGTQTNGVNTSHYYGSNGFDYSGDGGGGGGGGGGYYGGLGQLNGVARGASGGGIYQSSTNGANTFVVGPNGANNSSAATSPAAWGNSLSYFGYGNNYGGGGGAGAGGGAGIVFIRYSGETKASGGSITQVNGYTVHTFTSDSQFVLL